MAALAASGKGAGLRLARRHFNLCQAWKTRANIQSPEDLYIPATEKVGGRGRICVKRAVMSP